MRLNSRFEIFQWMMIHLKCLLLLYKSYCSLKCDTLYYIAKKFIAPEEKNTTASIGDRVVHRRSESYSIFHMDLFLCPKFGLFTKIF